MSKRFHPRFAVEWLENATIGVEHREIEEFLDKLHTTFKESSRPRKSRPSRDEPTEFNREAVGQHLLMALAKRDSVIAEVRQFDRDTRRRILQGIVSEAKRVSGLNVLSTSGVEEWTLILPGVLFGDDSTTFQFKDREFRTSEPRSRSLIRWAAEESSRISRRYGIVAEMAVIYLFLDEGFEPKPMIDWTYLSESDNPLTNRLIMEIDIHMSPKEVASAYAKAREDLGVSAQRTQREKTYALAAFFADLGEQPDWWAWLQRWNELCSHLLKRKEWTYGEGLPTASLVHQFARDVRYAIRSLVGDEACRTLLGPYE